MVFLQHITKGFQIIGHSSEDHFDTKIEFDLLHSVNLCFKLEEFHLETGDNLTVALIEEGQKEKLSGCQTGGQMMVRQQGTHVSSCHTSSHAHTATISRLSLYHRQLKASHISKVVRSCLQCLNKFNVLR